MSNVNTNSCIIRTNIKCTDKPCGENMECCQEQSSNISTCCAKGSCNKQTGLCSKPTKIQCPTYFYENNTTIEGYKTSKSTDRMTTIVLIFVILFLGYIIYDDLK